ncbi:MAG TPA: hypothetical protein VEX67_03940 [Solirubrobacteraceae bacterium]|nr:hypothetical protein [Solirubrobacteraceae bacterium]
MATTTISTPTHHAAADRSRGAQPLLAVTGMSKHFGPVEALVDVDFLGGEQLTGATSRPWSTRRTNCSIRSA